LAVPAPSKPSHLGVEGELLWSSVTALHSDLGPDTVRTLVDACREADLVQRLEDELRDAPLMVRGSQGQLVASPLVSEVRQHRSVLSALLKALKLPQTAGDAARAEQETSEKARAAVRARWDKPRLVSNG
jgi:hypothetical protein